MIYHKKDVSDSSGQDHSGVTELYQVGNQPALTGMHISTEHQMLTSIIIMSQLCAAKELFHDDAFVFEQVCMA
jgi:hypothetical protein